MAETEAELGLGAAYFVLVRSEFYNPAAPNGTRVLARLAALGHEIGLHFDAALYENDAGALDEAAARECTLLEQMTGTRVATISFHRPAPALLGRCRRDGRQGQGRRCRQACYECFHVVLPMTSRL